ncbi:hypothetical protein [Pseudomonas sp. dw_358]|uniref:hypothetical protein n=1 Tax=Pseudomonas sp. dw_358 TaxID=2720083 RepID=UPI001BD6B547|nr:hypothetical protein [Pseudomonas sp. dw_358]
MSVERFWCHEARNIRCVRESYYDALAQQLAASQAEVVKLNEAAAFMDNVNQGIEDGLRAKLAARDKRLEDAVAVIANTRRSLEKANESGAVIDTIWLDSPCSETLFDYLDAFLSPAEDKENGSR